MESSGSLRNPVPSPASPTPSSRPESRPPDTTDAGTRQNAWERLKEEDYDLLLLDVGLPDASGLELLPALRKSMSQPIPSLVISAQDLSPRTAKDVSAALLKSKTSNEELVRRIHSLLPAPEVRTPS
ncbi:MAG TPA: response regulator [Planctomycetota bacterium]|nr:response regulator [Planctomycetota bacterium]